MYYVKTVRLRVSDIPLDEPAQYLMETEDLVEQRTQLVKDLNINNDCLLGLRNMCKVNKYLYHTEFQFFSMV